MMRQIVSTALGLWLCAGSVWAEAEQGVVVELYTSQGCSSCPPADELLGQIAEMPGVIALALHVDYWDYIGWTDTFGQAKFTDRQKAYAHAAGENMIYTPQMIVAGQARVEGNRPDEVAAAIASAGAVQPSITLHLSRQGDLLDVQATALQALNRPMSVQLVQYLDKADVAIDRGENAGLSVAYHHVVTSWSKIGDWTGTEPLSLTAQAGTGPVVVIIQAEGPAEILAAARLK